MLSPDELRESRINPDIAREAFDQAEKRLVDALETKRSFEQKAFTLFGAYTTLAFALIGVSGSLFKSDGYTALVGALCVSGFVLVIGALLLIGALHERNYGALGSNPNMWLQRGTIDGEPAALNLMLAYVTYHHQRRITASLNSNRQMGRLIRLAIYAGVAAPVAAAVLLFTPAGACLKPFFLNAV